jgi:hypothetical protein
MLTLTGELLNVFTQPKGERDGKEYGGQNKVQILGKVGLSDGGTKMDMYTLTAHDIESFKDFHGKIIIVPVGVMPNGKSLTFFIPKATVPKLASAA